MFPLLVFAQEEINVKSTLSEVKVFLDQAQLKHTTPNFSIPKGQHTLIIQDVSTSIIPQTIQITGQGDFVILSTQTRNNFIQEKTVSKQIKLLEDSLETLKNKKSILEIQLNTYDNEEDLLLANKNIKGDNNGVTTAELEKMANFYRNRLVDIRTKKLELSSKIKKYNEQINKIQNQLNELKAQKNKPTGELLIEVYANANVQNAKLNFEYVCENAYWLPEYEIRVNDLKQPAQLILKAIVGQNTGIDWNNVKLSLSTSSPNLDQNKPILNPWYLNFASDYHNKKSLSKGKNKQNQELAYAEAPSSHTERDEYAACAVLEYTNKLDKATTQEYQIQIPVTILSNYITSRIDVHSINISARYSYYSVPKINESAYLLTEITDWEQYNLMPAPLFIFIENTYIGESEINPDITKDTLQISLGQDKSISVKRQMIKKFNEKKIIGNSRKEIRAYEISLKNKKNSNIEIVVEDQIPISTIQEIEVELLESSNAVYDKTTGKLTWKINLNPGEEKKLQFKFSVKYPKDKTINL
jgi:uncharacterized protein (TIGR02231 family)